MKFMANIRHKLTAVAFALALVCMGNAGAFAQDADTANAQEQFDAVQNAMGININDTVDTLIGAIGRNFTALIFLGLGILSVYLVIGHYSKNAKRKAS